MRPSARHTCGKGALLEKLNQRCSQVASKGNEQGSIRNPFAKNLEQPLTAMCL